MQASTSRLALPMVTAGAARRRVVRARFRVPIRLSSTKAASEADVPVRTKVLLNSLPHIPDYGFTRSAFLLSDAVQSTLASKQAGSDGELDRTRVLDTLFPGPPTVFDSELFRTWSQVHDLEAIYQTSADHIGQQLLSGHHPREQYDGTDAGRTRVEMRSSLSQDESREALLNVQRIVEDRLRSCWNVRQHMIHVRSRLALYTLLRTTAC